MHCDDFTRTDAERRSRLQAPISRRRLLQAGLGATISLYAARAMPLARAFEAAEASAADAPDAPVLVNVFVPGGLDLLDTLVPGDAYGRYADLRPALKVAQPLALAGTGFGVHPALGEGLNGGLKGLFDRGRLGFIPGIDYANPDLSHFNSRHFWETGLISINPAPGWLARWTDRHGGPDNPFQALSMDAGLSPLLRGSRNPVAAVQSPDDAQSWVPGVWGEWQDRMMEHYAAIAAQRPHGPGAAAVFAAARQSQLVARALKPYVKDAKTGADPLAPPVAYPGAENGEGTNGFAENLRYLAALLTLPLGIRVATVDAPGEFDTHDDQARDARARPRAALAGPERLPGRPRGARHRRPRADAGVDRVRPPARRRTPRAAPTTAPAASPGSWAPARAAGCCRPIPTSTPSTATTTSRSPPTSAPSTRACSSSGWAPAPTRCCPTPAASGASRSWHERADRRPRPGRRRPGHAGRAGHARVPLQRLPLERARRAP